MEYKFLGESGLTTIFSITHEWAQTAKAEAITAANSYTNTAISKIPKYELPIASTSALGGIKLGQGLQADSDGTVKVVLEGIEVDPTNIAKASKTGFGVVKAGEGIEIVEGVISVSHPDVEGMISTAIGAQKFKTVNGVSILGEGNVSIDLSLYKVVEALPEANIDENKIYLLANADGKGQNVYTEYMHVAGKWEIVGEYKADIDLAPYAKTADVDAKVAELNAAIGNRVLTSDFDAFKTSNTTAINSAKDDAIAAAAADAAKLYQTKADMPTFREYTETEIREIADAAIAKS